MELVKKGDAPQKLLHDLETIIHEGETFLTLLKENKRLFQVLMTPTVPRTLRRKVLGRLFDTLSLHAQLKDFLVLLNQRQRLPILKECLFVLKDMYMREAGIFPVTLKSAKTLAKVDASRIQNALFEKLNTLQPMAKPVFTLKTEPDLLAGYRIEIPGMVLDASFKKQMEQLQTYIHEGAL